MKNQKTSCSIKSVTERRSLSKKKGKPNQNNLKRNLQKQIKILTGEKQSKSARKSLNWKKTINEYSSKSFKNNDSTREGNHTFSAFANT